MSQHRAQMPCKCILYLLLQTVLLSAFNRLPALNGSGRLPSVFILASRELVSTQDLSSMESRPSRMESPTPAQHWTTTTLHSDAKSCKNSWVHWGAPQLLTSPHEPGDRQGCGYTPLCWSCRADPPRCVHLLGVLSCPCFLVHPRLMAQIRPQGNALPCCMSLSPSPSAPSFASVRMLIVFQQTMQRAAGHHGDQR